MVSYSKRGLYLFVVLLVSLLILPSVLSVCKVEGISVSGGYIRPCCQDKPLLGGSWTQHCACRGSSWVANQCDYTGVGGKCIDGSPSFDCLVCGSCDQDYCCKDGCYNDPDCVGSDCVKNQCLKSGVSPYFKVCDNGYWVGTDSCGTGYVCEISGGTSRCVDDDDDYQEQDTDTRSCTPGTCKDGCNRYTSTSCTYQKDFTCGGGFCPCCAATGSCNSCCGCTSSACPNECGSASSSPNGEGSLEDCGHECANRGCSACKCNSPGSGSGWSSFSSTDCSPCYGQNCGSPSGGGSPSCVSNQGDSCGTCGTGRISCSGSCEGAHCTYSPSCSPTTQYRCNNGNVEKRTRSTNCCGGCSGWSSWKVYDNCKAKDAWCRSNACVDCDTDLDICNQCGGTWLVGPYNQGFNNLACCRNLNTGATNEYVKYHEEEWGGTACCNEATDCAISDKVCVNNLESDYTNANMMDDSICVQGNLMSRTKMVALQMLTMAKNNPAYNGRYVLFCDDKTDALNKISEGEDTLTDVNNICVMSYKNNDGSDAQIIIGTSLNQGSNFIGLFADDTVCNDVIQGVDIPESEMNKFHKCSGHDNIYYNPVAYAVIFSTQPLQYVNEPHWTVALTEFLTDLINNILGTSFNEENNINFLDERDERYTEIYVNKIGSKAIRAIKEPRFEQYNEVETIIASYNGFTSTVCEGDESEMDATTSRGRPMIKKPTGLVDKDFNCSKEGNEHLVYMKNESFSYGWLDLTAKLRPVYT